MAARATAFQGAGGSGVRPHGQAVRDGQWGRSTAGHPWPSPGFREGRGTRALARVRSHNPFRQGRPLDSFRILPHLVALVAAYALAVPIGWDREKSGRSAGLRTFPLVSVAACSFVQATETLLADHLEGAARIIGGVITGIGLIGGSAIVKHGTSVLGTATAASLWATGAMGVSVGLGAYDLAMAVSLLIFATLRFIVPRKDGTQNHGKAEP